jgi:hypothetical protein
VLDRPAQLAGSQPVAVSFTLPALQCGHARFEWDINDPPERQPTRTRAYARSRAHVVPRRSAASISAVICTVAVFIRACRSGRSRRYQEGAGSEPEPVCLTGRPARGGARGQCELAEREHDVLFGVAAGLRVEVRVEHVDLRDLVDR